VSKPSPTPELSLVDLISGARRFAHTVRAEHRSILLSTVGALALGLFFALGSGEEYKASIRLLPYSNGAGGGSLSGLAGLAGIRLSAGAVDQTISADLYPEVAGSQDFRIAVAEAPLRFESLNRSATTVEYFRDIRELPATEWLFRSTVGLPRIVFSRLRAGSADTSSTGASLPGAPVIPRFDREYLDYVKELDERLSVAVDKRTSVITIAATMPDAYAAADLVRVTSDLLMKRVIEYESRKAAEQYRFATTQQASARERHDRAQMQLARFADRNRILNSATAQIERDRLQREYDVAFEVYQQLSREIEQAKLKMNQDTPVFTVLEAVSVPAGRASPRRGRILILSLGFGLLVGISGIWIRQMLANA
jgi:uncharacterized protein involved in exopolysaccharide biosynthesis